MGFELTRMVNKRPKVQFPSIVLKQANKARYAIACAAKEKFLAISTIADSCAAYLKTNHKKNTVMLGVDITPSCIYVCQVDIGSSGATLTGLSSVCMEGKFISNDILNNPNIYSDSLKKLLRDNKMSAKKVAVSLPVSSSIVRVATISKMDDSDIKLAIKYGSLWQNIMNRNDSPDNYSIFYQVIRREATSQTMDILLVATKLADISLYKKIIERSGLTPIVVDAKTIALHSAIKNNPAQNFKSGTLLIEIGLENNYIMVIGEDRPRIIDVPISATQRSALIGSNDSPEEVAGVVSLYKNAIDNIINQRGRGNNPLYINDIYVSSSLPLVNNFISKLGEEFTNCNVSECNIFDHLIIPDDFMINKQSAEHNISAWAGAISMAVMPWKNRKEEWIEIRKSPSYGIKYIRHYGKGWNLKDLSTKIGNFNPYAILAIGRKIGFTSLAFYVNGLALATFAAAGFMMLNSYKELTEQRATLSVNDVAFSDVVAIYDEKSGQIAAMQDALEQMQSVEDAAIEFTKEENQQYVLSMYSYLDNVLQQGVWLKELTFTAPTTIEIEGRSMDDNGVTKFLGTLDNSKMFANMALKHIQSISELDLYAKNSVYMKSFFMKGHLSETLPDAYLYKPSMVAGDIHHGS